MMRRKFIETLVKIAEKDERVYLLTADMGFGLVEPFSTKFPQRFINVGVAEQNMIGIATGLSMTGKIVFVYSITNFPTLRCVEQIRNCVCYHNAKVHIVAGGTGFSYGAIGMSHHSTEDIAIMRALPNLTVVSPSLPEVELATKEIYNSKSPCYLRLGWVNADDTQAEIKKFVIGKAETLITGDDVCLVSAGSMLPNTVKAAKELLKLGIKSSVISMHTIKPIDVKALVSSNANLIFTIEEHSIIGGLGSAVGEVIIKENLPIELKCLGVPDEYCTKIGNRNELLRYYKLDVENIVKEVKDAIN
jgi:transketolase